MKKKKKEQLKEIERLKERLQDNLAAYLNENSRWARKKYKPYVELLQLLKAINFGRMEMHEVTDGPTIVCPNVKMDTMRKLSICLTIIYTHMNCRLSQSSAVIPDELNLYLDKFENMLEKFLFY